MSTPGPLDVRTLTHRAEGLAPFVLRAGEAQDISGAAPYKLRIGNVSGTRVEWRGAVVNLTERAKDNIARLELN